MQATTQGYYLQGGAVRCHIDSLIPFTLRFSRNGRQLGSDQLFRYGPITIFGELMTTEFG